MRFISALLFLMLLTLARADNTINVLVNTRDLTSQPLARRNVTITPSAPLSRTLYTNIFSREPRTQATSASGSTTFSNVAWGYYWLDIGSPVGSPPNQFTRFGLVIGTNNSGTVSAHLLTTNNAILPPTPAAYYYTTNEVDALISSGSGSATNVYHSVGAGGIVVSTNGLLFTIDLSAGATNWVGTMATNAVKEIRALTNGINQMKDSTDFIMVGEGQEQKLRVIWSGTGHSLFAPGIVADDSSLGFIGSGAGVTNLPFTALSSAGKLAVTNAVNTQLAYYTATNSSGGDVFPVPIHTLATNAASLILAVNNSGAGTNVGIASGTYSIGTNNLVPPMGVNVYGAGSSKVNILGYADCWGVETYSAPSGGPQFSPGDNQIIQGFTLTCDTNSMYPLPFSGAGAHSHMWSGFGMSAANPPSNRSHTNVLVRDVVVNGGWFDSFHYNPKSNRCEVRFESCGGWNEGQVWDFYSATGGNTNSVYTLVNCYGYSYGHFPSNLVSLTAMLDPAAIVIVDGPQVNAINFHGGLMFDATSRTNFAKALDVIDNGIATVSYLNLVGGMIYTYPTDYSYTNNKITGSFTVQKASQQTPVRKSSVQLSRQNGLELFNPYVPASLVWRSGITPTDFVIAYQDEFTDLEMLRITTDRILMDSSYSMVGSFTGNGSGLTNLPNGAVKLPTALSNVVNLASNNYVGTFTGDGSGLTNLSVSGSSGLPSLTTLRQTVVKFSEFLGNPGTAAGSCDENGLFSSAVSGAAATQQLSETNAFGIWRISTGTSATSGPMITSLYNSGRFYHQWVTITNEWRVRLQDLPTSAETFIFRCGFGDTIGAAVSAQAAYFQYSTNDARFELVCRNSGSETRLTNTTTVATNVWYKLKIVLTGGNALFYVNDADAVTNAGLPSVSTRNFAPICQLVKTNGTTARTLDIDYFYQGYSLPFSR